MSAGEDALREAAQLETARVYGGVVKEYKQPRSVLAARIEAMLSTSPQAVVHNDQASSMQCELD